ncbi:hypothetical protein GCM10007170_03190 [Arthrobacter liuii]|uniref:Uncharacterized protein n=1 Tax=Arthrobacter liuii TaxID=1476996 RepID=A0ABQ2AD77_9MICC|nr:hypothetical protein GCM10007170_03190 [Arthrobacter liuii]
MDHANAGSHRLAGILENNRLAIDQDFTFGRVVQAVEYVHQGGFPGTVLSQEAVHLPRFDDQIDVVIGYQGPESLRDPFQFEFQNPNQSVCVWICFGTLSAARQRVVPA